MGNIRIFTRVVSNLIFMYEVLGLNLFFSKFKLILCIYQIFNVYSKRIIVQ